MHLTRIKQNKTMSNNWWGWCNGLFYRSGIRMPV